MTSLAPPLAAQTASMAVFGVFAVVGIVLATWMSRLPAIRDALGVTPGQRPSGRGLHVPRADAQ